MSTRALELEHERDRRAARSSLISCESMANSSYRRNIDRGHPRLEAAPEVETVAIMIAEKSFRHSEGHGNGKHGCEVQHRVAGHVLLVH